MPYVKQESRNKLSRVVRALRTTNANTSGELNYLLTQVCLAYLDNHEENYQVYNDIIGALSACSLELYRRRVSVLEDEKIKENGDL